MELFNRISNTPVIIKHGPKLALAFAVLCLVALILITGLGMRAQAQIKAENYAPQKLQSKQKKQRQNYRVNDIVKSNLFGNAKQKVTEKKAPKTTLNLTLLGVLSSTDSPIGRAIIKSGRSKEAELYSIGDEIKGAGASIKEIRPLEVILNRNGAIESLPLNKKSSKGNGFVFTPVTSDNAPGVIDDEQSNNVRATSVNGEPRKIRKPNFSGLDRAIEKLGEN